MDWQDKFSSILRETEANLFKARHRYKLESGLPLHPEMRKFQYSSPIQKSTSLLDFSTSSIPTSVHQNGFSSSQSPNKYPAPLTTVNGLDTHADSCYLGQSFQDRIEQQNRTIEQLTQQVKRLENERSHYDDQFRDIKNEIHKLSNKLTERQSSNQTELLEQRIEHVQQEIWSELLNLRNQIHFSNTIGNTLASTVDNTLPPSAMPAYTMGVKTVKNDTRTSIEMDGLKQDMELLKTKLVSIQTSLASHLCDQLDGKRERLKKDWCLTATSNTSAIHRGRQNMSLSSRNLSERSPQTQIDQLSSTVTMMKRKLDNMELHTGSNKSVNGPDCRKPNIIPSLSDDLSIMTDSGSSLSDHLCENFTDSDPDRQLIHSASDDELSFENLSLSEEDSVVANSITGDEDKTSLESEIFQSDEV